MSQRRTTTKTRKPATSVFAGLSCLLFLALILSLTLHIGTSKYGTTRLVSRYITEAELNTEYFENYENVGFTKDDCYRFLKSEEVTGVLCDVMTDRVDALFHNTENYIHTEDECYDRIRNALDNYCIKNGITLKDGKLNTLTKYTLDISGITAMFVYDSPAVYRTSIFEAEEGGKAEEYEASFKALASLTKPAIPAMFAIMYIISVVIMCILGGDLFKVANTILYPSFLASGISLGYVFGASNGAVLSDYVFKSLLFSSGMCFIFGLIFTLAVYFYTKKTDGGKSKFDTWLKNIKSKYAKKEKRI